MAFNFSTSHETNYRLTFPFMSFLETSEAKEKGDSVLLFCKSVTLPGVDLGVTTVGSQFIEHKEPSKDLSFGNLDITFAVDELFNNYKFLYNWITYAKDPERFGIQRSMIDATLSILSNKKNVKVEISLKNLFPISLSSIPFTYESEDINDLDISASFAFNYFTIT